MNEIVMKAFMDELEKQAGFIDFIPKLMSYASGMKGAFTKGMGEGFKYLESFKSPSFMKAVDGTMSAAAERANTGWIQKGIGDSVGAVKGVFNGVSKEAPVMSNVKTVGKNLYNTAKQQITDARFKTVDLDATKTVGGADIPKYNVVNKNGQDFLRGGGIMPDRQILGRTADGKAIVKKRMLAQGAAIAFTPVGFGVQSAVMDKPSQGAKDAALWTFARPVGELNMIKDFVIK